MFWVKLCFHKINHFCILLVAPQAARGAAATAAAWTRAKSRTGPALHCKEMLSSRFETKMWGRRARSKTCYDGAAWLSSCVVRNSFECCAPVPEMPLTIAHPTRCVVALPIRRARNGESRAQGGEFPLDKGRSPLLLTWLCGFLPLGSVVRVNHRALFCNMM